MEKFPEAILIARPDKRQPEGSLGIEFGPWVVMTRRSEPMGRLIVGAKLAPSLNNGSGRRLHSSRLGSGRDVGG